MSITETDIERELAQHRDTVKACEARARKEALELERARNALVERGNTFFNGRLLALRDSAISYAKDAASKLAKLPPAPIKPALDMVNTEGFDAFMAADEAWPAKRDAHAAAVRAACGHLAPALRGLSHQASAVRRRCRELGFSCFQGVGFLREDQRKPRPGPLVGFDARGRDLIHAVADLADSGELRADQCEALIALLNEAAPQMPASPEDAPQRIWERIRKADDDRAYARELAERAARGEGTGRVEEFRGEFDADRYIARVSAGAQRPIGERAIETPQRGGEEGAS